MGKIKGLTILNALSLILQVTLAIFIQLQYLNNTDISTVASKYPTLFNPAPVTFGIWGIIYSGLGIFCLYHIIIAFKHTADNPSNNDIDRAGILFIITNCAAAGWMIAWIYEQMLLSALLMLVQLVCLCFIHTRLHIYARHKTIASRMCTQFPLSVYLAWIAIATIANISAYLVSIGWAGGSISPVDWTNIMVCATVLLAVYVVFKRHNIYFGLTIIWGIRGIAVQRELENAILYSSIITISWIGTGIVLLCCFIQLIRNLFLQNKRQDQYQSPTTSSAHRTL